MQLIINQQNYQVDDSPDRLLLWVLRDELGLTGTKFGCGIGICGSCTVHLDGVPARACVTMLSSAQEAEILTIEGLAEVAVNGAARLHPVQQAFLDEQVPQCSWCMSGQMMTAAALLEQNPNPSADEIRQAMNGVYCRCGTYTRIRKAVARAAELKAGS
jgi:isoquinoline 1-oxidoreductase alpha subunit